MKKLFYSSRGGFSGAFLGALVVLAVFTAAALSAGEATAQSPIQSQAQSSARKEYSVAIAVKKTRSPVAKYFSGILAGGLKKAMPQISVERTLIAYEDISAAAFSSYDAVIVLNSNTANGLAPEIHPFVSANKANQKFMLVALYKDGEKAVLPAGIDALTSPTPKKYIEGFIETAVTAKLLSVLGIKQQ